MQKIISPHKSNNQQTQKPVVYHPKKGSSKKSISDESCTRVNLCPFPPPQFPIHMTITPALPLNPARNNLCGPAVYWSFVWADGSAGSALVASKMDNKSHVLFPSAGLITWLSSVQLLILSNVWGLNYLFRLWNVVEINEFKFTGVGIDSQWQIHFLIESSLKYATV